MIDVELSLELIDLVVFSSSYVEVNFNKQRTITVRLDLNINKNFRSKIQTRQKVVYTSGGGSNKACKF